jgi:hypothetical protein
VIDKLLALHKTSRFHQVRAREYRVPLASCDTYLDV